MTSVMDLSDLTLVGYVLDSIVVRQFGVSTEYLIPLLIG